MRSFIFCILLFNINYLIINPVYANLGCQTQCEFIPQISKIKKVNGLNEVSNVKVDAISNSILTLKHNSSNVIEVSLSSLSGDYNNIVSISHGESLELNLIDQLYLISIQYKEIPANRINASLPNDSKVIGFETMEINLTKNKTVNLDVLNLNKILGVSFIKDFSGLVLDDESAIPFMTSVDIFNGYTTRATELSSKKNLYVAVGELTESTYFTYSNWFLLSNISNEKNTSFLHVKHELDSSDQAGKVFEVFLESSPFVEINFPVNYLNGFQDFAYQVVDKNFYEIFPFENKQITIFGIEGIAKQQFAAVRLIGLNQKSVPIAETPGFNFDHSSHAVAMKFLRVDLRNNYPIKQNFTFLSPQLAVQGNSIFWEMSVSYVEDGYLVGLLMPYSRFGHLSDIAGNSYNQGFNNRYKLYCGDLVLEDAPVPEDMVFNLTFDEDNCVQHELVFEFDSYLNNQTYRSSATYKFDESALADQANGGAFITDIQLFEGGNRVIDSIVGANPYINVAFFLELPTEYNIEISLGDDKWLPLEQEVDTRSLSIKSKIPLLPNGSIIDVKINFKFWGEEITQLLRGFIYVNFDDADSDNDGVFDYLDAFPFDSTETVDSDNDGIGNNADLDDDNDGVEDSLDAFPLDSFESIDSDNDGIGNNADPDDDNDGVIDSEDIYPLDPTLSSLPKNSNTSDANSSGGALAYLLLIVLFSLYWKKSGAKFN